MGGFGANLASHWWIILIIILLVFGATRLPQLAKGIGQSINILKSEVKRDEAKATDVAPTTTTGAAPAPTAGATAADATADGSLPDTTRQ